MATPTAADLIAAGLSESMAYHAVAGTRNIGIPLALWLHERDGLKVGPLSGKTPAEIRLLRGMYSPAAPESVIARRANLATSKAA